MCFFNPDALSSFRFFSVLWEFINCIICCETQCRYSANAYLSFFKIISYFPNEAWDIALETFLAFSGFIFPSLSSFLVNSKLYWWCWISFQKIWNVHYGLWVAARCSSELSMKKKFTVSLYEELIMYIVNITECWNASLDVQEFCLTCQSWNLWVLSASTFYRVLPNTSM